MDLATRGRFDLHRPLVELLPAERGPATLRGDVTVHHLLCHCSGIADYFEERTATDYASLWARVATYSVLSPPMCCRSSRTCRRTGLRVCPFTSPTPGTCCWGC